MTIKVSVIIPTYNRSGLITETIESVLNQSFRDFELIVIDDGSSDETPHILSKYGDNIRYVRQENGGVNNARNHGLSLSRGEYIALLDDDDFWIKDKLKSQVQILDSFPGLAYTYSNFNIYKNANAITRNGIQTWYPRTHDWNTIFNQRINFTEITPHTSSNKLANGNIYIGKIYHSSLSEYFVLPSTSLIRRSKIPDKIRFPEHDPICGDWDFFARLSRNNQVAYYDVETTYNRSHEDDTRLTRTPWKKQLEFRIDMLERLYLQDNDFYMKYQNEVDTVYHSRIVSLGRQYLLDQDKQLMNNLLIKYSNHFSRLNKEYILLSFASCIPGINKILHGLRRIRG